MRNHSDKNENYLAAYKAALLQKLLCIPLQWQEAIEAGWIIQERSKLMCGGYYIWFIPKTEDSYTCVGCVCHTRLEDFGFKKPTIDDLQEAVSSLYYQLNSNESHSQSVEQIVDQGFLVLNLLQDLEFHRKGKLKPFIKVLEQGM